MRKPLTALDVIRGIDFDVKPERWLAGCPFENLDIRPGRIILIGAPPGAGKTTLAVQLVTSVLEHQTDLRCVIGNVELSPRSLVDKILASKAGVPVDGIQDHELADDERAAVDAVAVDHADMLGRLSFIESPFTIKNIANAMKEIRARFAVLDYVQRFTNDSDKDARTQLDKLMGNVRLLANANPSTCLIVVSSVSRQTGKTGSTYSGTNLASFRGSAELEFGADDAYLLDADDSGTATLRCLKKRFGRKIDTPLRFNGPLQQFTLGDALDGFDSAPSSESKGKGAA